MNSAKFFVLLGCLCLFALVQFCANEVAATSPALSRLRKAHEQRAAEQMVAEMQFGEAPPSSEWEVETSFKQEPQATGADASHDPNVPVPEQSAAGDVSEAQPLEHESEPEQDVEVPGEQLQQQLQPQQPEEQSLSPTPPLEEQAPPASLLEQHNSLASGTTTVDRFACPPNRADCLKVVSFNTYMRPTTLFFNNQGQRSVSIPTRMDSLAADVVCFQELFDDTIRLNVQYGMMQHGFRYGTRVVGVDSGVKQDGGVIIMSKHLIENGLGELRIYADCSGDDCLSMKGVVYARINKAGMRYHVFCSHLQAMDGSHHRSVRAKQFQTIKSFITDMRIPANEPLVIAGDMNVNLYTEEIATMKSILYSEFTMPDDCQAGGSYFYQWRGTAPFCDANSADCTLNGCDYVRSDSVGDGSRCWSGQKVQCRCLVTSSCSVYTYDPARNKMASGNREWLDYVMWSRAHKHPVCHTMRVRGDIELSDHYPVESVLYVGGTCGVVAAPPPPQYQYKWVGTSPFCKGKVSDCNNGWTFVRGDRCGDGACCFSGSKVQCRRQIN